MIDYGSLNSLSIHFHKLAKEAGWWPFDDEYFIATKFALVHSEVSEAFEGFRKDSPDDHLVGRKAVEVELADVLIRVFDLAGKLNLNLGDAVREKEQYNAQRADHKLEHRQLPGGKKF